MDTGTVYEYWRSEEARKERNDPIAQYIRRQEEWDRNPDPCKFHDIDCPCADCQWEEEAEFRPYPYKSDDELEREAELAEFDRDSDCMEASWNREGRCHTRMQS